MAKRQDRKVYSFKSVGDLDDDRIAQNYIPEPTPIGIKTPLQLGNGTNIYLSLIHI